MPADRATCPKCGRRPSERIGVEWVEKRMMAMGYDPTVPCDHSCHDLADRAPALAAEVERLREALVTLGDRRFWRLTGGAFWWAGESHDGNLITEQDPTEIARAALHPDQRAGARKETK